MTRSTPISFAGQVGLVTGAASGLGLAYARLLARREARVVMHDVGAGLDGTGHDPDRIARAVAELTAQGLDVHAAHGRIDNRADCLALVAAILQQHGRLDFIIHNAGWVEYQPIEALEEDRFDAMMTLAAKTPLWLAQAAWPAMRQAGYGRIVLTTSDRALYPQYVQHGLAAYAAAKLAAVGIVNVLAAEGAAHGIVVNAVSPVAKTRMWGVDGEPDELHPDAVAPGVAFLASAACVDGGWILRASNGQFHATRSAEAEGVAYPRDLRAVHAGSIEAIAGQWPAIAPTVVEPRGPARCGT
ncbi:SDR family NAD(P)-dependent oxidoreductase [Stenotrophomonas sp.]|uniref:SDR family NAD(P)-dependent oxidoreductase n=1 Tax=Stenotrophomonas sp. TaxID=69392 RepID=UPI002FCACD0C